MSSRGIQTIPTRPLVAAVNRLQVPVTNENLPPNRSGMYTASSYQTGSCSSLQRIDALAMDRKNNHLPLLLGLFFIFALSCCLPMRLAAAEGAEATPPGLTDPPARVKDAPEPESRPPCAANPDPTLPSPEAEATSTRAQGPGEEPADLEALRQRYNQDPTGVRARLGFCGRGRGGPGCGRHRYGGGGPRWNRP